MHGSNQIQFAHPHAHSGLAWQVTDGALMLGGAGFAVILARAGLEGLGFAGPSSWIGVAAFPVGMVLGSAVARLVWPRTVTARRTSREVIGLREPIPLNEGLIEVRGRAADEEAGAEYELLHRTDRKQTTLFSGCRDESEARAAAESICRLGHYPMQWTPAGGAKPELRPLEDIDKPLADRLVENPELLAPMSPPPVPGFSKSRRMGVLELVETPAAKRGWAGLVATAVLAVALFAMARSTSDRGPLVPALLAACGVAAVFVLRELVVRLTRYRFWVDSREVVQTIAVGPVVVRTRHIAVEKIESIHLEHRAQHHLALAGDGFYVRVARFAKPDDATYARHLVCVALALSRSPGADRAAAER